MESLNGTLAQPQEEERPDEWTETTDTVLELVGGFLFINGVYFAVFTTSIYTAIVFYAFLLMLLTGIGYSSYFTAEDVEDLLYEVVVLPLQSVRELRTECKSLLRNELSIGVADSDRRRRTGSSSKSRRRL